MYHSPPPPVKAQGGSGLF